MPSIFEDPCEKEQARNKYCTSVKYLPGQTDAVIKEKMLSINVRLT